MAIGPQVVQSRPAAILTIAVGTKGHRGVHGTGAAVRWWHGSGLSRRRWRSLAGLSLTQGTVGLVRQARERFGRGGMRALGLRCHGWGRQAWLGPREMQDDEEPDDGSQSELVEKLV
jgi:hypothetical protein